LKIEEWGKGRGWGAKNERRKIMNRTYRRLVGSVLPVLAFSLLGVGGSIAVKNAARRGEVARV